MKKEAHSHPYTRLALMAALSFLAMYALMYSMVNVFSNVFASFNQAYMAALMTAPMVIIELLVMRGMYSNKPLNVGIVGFSIIALVGAWFLIREQVAVSNVQFMRSMIPHHAGAILMCEKAALSDKVLIDLCKQIVAGQQREIEQMKERLQVLAR